MRTISMVGTLFLLASCSEYGVNSHIGDQPLGEETAVDTDTVGTDPVAVCAVNPEQVAPPFEDAEFIGGDSYDPEGMEIAEYEWTFASVPEGSSISMPGGNAANRTVTPDVAGDYVAQLIVRTEDGRESEPCLTTLEAVPTENLWVEMFWENSGDDMDLHLLAPNGSPRSDKDCYYANTMPEWGTNSDADDPALDLDDIPGIGPENINIAAPQNGTFTVFVHDYPGSVYEGTNNVTVNIYIDGQLEWSDTRGIYGEDYDMYFAEIEWPSGEISSL